jgi:hypothetical protein
MNQVLLFVILWRTSLMAGGIRIAELFLDKLIYIMWHTAAEQARWSLAEPSV